MIYNAEYHRWELEVDDTEELGDIVKQYGSYAKAERELKKQSRTVYNWIYGRIPTENKDLIEYMLAKDPRFLTPLKEALIAQLEYDLETGGNAVGKQIGIDFVGGAGNADRGRIKQAQVSIEVENILTNATSEFNIFYMGDYCVRLGDNRYAERNY